MSEGPALLAEVLGPDAQLLTSYITASLVFLSGTTHYGLAAKPLKASGAGPPASMLTVAQFSLRAKFS